ncbi:MAG: hypothetical protein PVJ86_05410 [Phycisphaerales bacterium]|jgi:hypothetical protein
MLEIFLAALMLHTGVATYYSEEQFGGGPLYCDQFLPGETLIYDRETPDWAAFDETWYKDGTVACGDLMLLAFGGGETLLVRAWDAGRFGKFYVESWGPDLPIIVDLPEHLRPSEQMSWPVVLVNLSRLGLDDGLTE